MSGGGDDSSSSEDENNLEILKESIDHDLFSQSTLNVKDGKCGQNVVEKVSPIKCIKDSEVPDESHFENHGLSQSNRDFIAKKLIEKLSKTIELENGSTLSSESVETSETFSGIKLFASSNTLLTKIEEPNESAKVMKRKETTIYDEKLNKKKCKEVAIDPETIFSQDELKHWTDRKPTKVFKYKKHKKMLLQVQ